VAQFPFSELLNGTRRLFAGLQAKKSDGSMETLKSNDQGALLAQITNSEFGVVGVNPVEGRLPVEIGGASVTVNAGDVFVDDVQAKTIPVTLQNAATIAGGGTSFVVGAYKTLTVSVTGTSTSRTVVFEAADTNGNYTPIQGVRLSDFAMDSQTTGTGEKWTFEVTGVTTFRARIDEIAGGDVTITGMAVA